MAKSNLALLIVAALISRTKASGASFLPKIDSREKISLSKSKASYSALDIPRGGAVDGADVAKKAYYALFGAHGLVSTLAPTETGKILYNDKFEIEEDSLAEMSMSYVGTCLIGCLYMALLAFTTDMSAPTIVAHGTYPCALMNWRYLLQGKHSKFGISKTAGIVMTLGTTVLPAMIRSGKFDSALIAKVNILVPVLMGALGFVNRELGMKVFGYEGKLDEADGVTRAICGWFCDSMAMWAIVAGLLLAGYEARVAVGCSALFFFVDLVNNNYLSKRNEALDTDPIPDAVFALILGGISYGLLA